MTERKVLLVEDDPDDVELTLAVLREHGLADLVIVARDGAEALDYLYCRGSFIGRRNGDPVVVLLDLKMPRVDGLEVLRQLKTDPDLKVIPVVVLTSSRQDRDIIESYDLGANAYVVKPVAFDKFVEVITQVSSFWILTNEVAPGLATRC